MLSPGQRRGSCGHAMVNFDSHAFCARCREKGKGTDDCVKNPQSSDCKICNAFSEEQRLQLATPSYRIKKEKREAKKLEATPAKDSEELIDPASVSVIGPVEKPSTSKSPVEAPPDGWCFMVEPAKLVPAKIFYRTWNLYHVWGCGRGRGNFNWGRCGGGGGEVW